MRYHDPLKVPRSVSNDAEYFHDRAIEEQVAAQLATCPEARRRHDELATMYRFRELCLRRCASAPAEAVENGSRTAQTTAAVS